MADETVARRYAAAFFNTEKAAGSLDAAATDMNTVAAQLVAVPRLAQIAAHPLIDEKQKKEAVAKALAASVRPSTLAFLNLLIDRRRIALLGEIKSEFDIMLRRQRNVAAAVAVSAVPLTAKQQSALEKALEKRTGKDIELTTEVDGSLMGGMLIRMGDTVIDGTVKGKLERLRERLLERTN